MFFSALFSASDTQHPNPFQSINLEPFPIDPTHHPMFPSPFDLPLPLNDSHSPNPPLSPPRTNTSLSLVPRSVSLFGFALPSLSLAASSAGAPLPYYRSPLPPPKPFTAKWFPPVLVSSSSSISPSSAPVLNLNPSGSPLTFRSAVKGPFRAQWLRASDNELIKLVETSRTLCPVHLAASSPTYYNPVAREK